MSLYNTYRPKDWNSVIGQDYITTILKNSIISGRVHHAYLFHGSRGTGKTTSARILAKTINCLDKQWGNPCHTCANCQAFDNDTLLDIIEIDGASNNGVENVRDLIEKARFEPNQGAYKVYIIDEVHMLSTGAFNALLKTLEQPPKHVKFILATTEIDKVPETIRSRTLRFDFRKIGIADLIGRMEYICKQEWVRAETSSLEIIAKAARWGFRDALTLLEQNIIDKEVSTEHVRHTLGLIEESLVDACVEAIRDQDIPKTLELIEHLKDRHIEARGFLEQIMYRVRDRMIESLDQPVFSSYNEIMSLLEHGYSRVRVFPDGMMLIELTLLRIAKRGSLTTHSEKVLETPKVASKKEMPALHTKESPSLQKMESSTPPKEKEKQIPLHEPISPTHIEEKSETSPASFSFPALINHLKKDHLVLSWELKTTQFKQDGTTLNIIFQNDWNYGRVNTSKTKSIIAEALATLFWWSWTVECALDTTGGSSIRMMAHDVF